MVFRTCMGFLHDREDSEDLTQEIFISAYQSLHRFKGDSSFSTWIYRIAVNASLNKVRKSSRNIFLRMDNLSGDRKEREMPFPDSYTLNPENILIRDEHAERVRKALDSLPEKQRTAIVLSKYDDLPQKEIAEIMGLTEGAVEALLHRAKKNLHEKLAPPAKKK